MNSKKKQSAWSIAAEQAQRKSESAPASKSATEKMTLYLSWEHIDKLNTLQNEYWKTKRKRTDHNKLLRLLIERATLDDVL